MYVNINRYYKIYYKYPPSIIYLPRANARKKRKEKKEKFAPQSVKICESTLTFLLFFSFSAHFFVIAENLTFRRIFSRLSIVKTGFSLHSLLENLDFPPK